MSDLPQNNDNKMCWFFSLSVEENEPKTKKIEASPLRRSSRRMSQSEDESETIVQVIL